MRAVSLSDKKVQKLVAEKFVPVKVVIKAGGGFPEVFPALDHWRNIYKVMGGEGFTGCVVASKDGEVRLADTGSAMVWELFDSTAYDAKKFEAMLQRGLKRQKEYDEITKPFDRARFRWKVGSEVGKEGRFRLPPKGFTKEKAIELFTLTGDYVPPKE